MSSQEEYTIEQIGEKIESIKEAMVWLIVNFNPKEINSQILSLKENEDPPREDLLKRDDGKTRKFRLIDTGNPSSKLLKLESLLTEHEDLLVSLLDYIEINKGQLPPSELKKMTLRPVDKLNSFYQATSLNKARAILESIMSDNSKEDIVIVLNGEFNLRGRKKIRYANGKLSSNYYEGIDDLLSSALLKQNFRQLVTLVRRIGRPPGPITPKEILELILSQFNRSRPIDFKFDN